MTGRARAVPRLVTVSTALALLLPVSLAATPRAAIAADSAETLPATVTLDRRAVDAGPGQKVRFQSRIENTGVEPLTDVVAHLSVLSTDPDVFVDPEDWARERTQYIDDLGPGDSTSLTWSVQAVTSGPIQLIVSVTAPGRAAVSAGPVDLTVAGQRVVNAGGVLPLVLWIPLGVLALLGATLLRRLRHR
jgi:hypothetical protein